MPALALLLIPLIPGLVSGILQIVDAIRTHPDTPQAAKDQLDAIATTLDDLKTKVAAVRV